MEKVDDFFCICSRLTIDYIIDCPVATNTIECLSGQPSNILNIDVTFKITTGGHVGDCITALIKK